MAPIPAHGVAQDLYINKTPCRWGKRNSVLGRSGVNCLPDCGRGSQTIKKELEIRECYSREPRFLKFNSYNSSVAVGSTIDGYMSNIEVGHKWFRVQPKPST
jgi:hypothetical protein